MKNLALGVASTIATLGAVKAQNADVTTPTPGTTQDTTEHLTTRPVDAFENDPQTIDFATATTGYDPEQPVIGGVGLSTGAILGESNGLAISGHADLARLLSKAKVSGTLKIGSEGVQLADLEAMLDLFIGASFTKSDGLTSATAGFGYGRGFPYVGAGGSWSEKASGFRMEYKQNLSGAEHGNNKLHLEVKAAVDFLKNKNPQAGEDQHAVLLRPAFAIDYALNDNVALFGRVKTGFSLGDVGIRPSTSIEVGVRKPIFADPADFSDMFNL